MKKTGIKWLPEIPENWELSRIKYYFYLSKSKAHDEDPVVLRLARSGIQVRDLSTNEGQIAASYENYNPVVPGDLLLNTMDLQSGANCNVSEVSGVISPAYANLRPLGSLNPKFYDYYFKCQYWVMAMFANGKGISFDNRWTMNSETLLNYYIPVLEIKEQNLIVNKIGTECRRIDELIAIEQEQIEKLKAYFKAVITEVCSVGMNSQMTKMKKSPLPWLNEVPEHWDCVKAKHILKKLNRPLEPDDNVVICSNSGKAFYRGEKSYGLISMTENGYQGVEPGDLLIHGMDTWHGAIAVSDIRGKCTSVVHVCETDHCQRFIAYYLRSLAFRNVYKAITNGVRQNTSDYRSWDKAGTIELLIPPVLEQEIIANYLDEKSLQIDKLIALKEEKIEKLQEYKKSLIYEYVTGKKEVI